MSPLKKSNIEHADCLKVEMFYSFLEYFEKIINSDSMKDEQNQ